MAPITMSADDLHGWSTRVLTALGYAPPDAAYLADTLVDANLRGVDSHGVIRLPVYARRVAAGLVDPHATPAATRSGAVTTLDGRRAAGQLVARTAVDAVADAAAEFGVGVATARGSAHFGAAGFYARALAHRGMIGIVCSNSEPNVVPHGGRSALLGTNPLAFAAPGTRPGDEPVCLDMATSSTAMGRVMVAASKGERIPADWGVDADGRPTTDPDAVVSLLPAAGPKGFGLAFFVEILAGVLSGSAVAHGLGNMYRDFDRPQDVGHFFAAFDIAHFLPAETFGNRLAGLVDETHDASPAPGVDAVLAPGDPETRTAAARRRDGIPLAPDTVDELRALGRDHGAAFPH